MLKKINISSFDISKTGKIQDALDITCDFYSAKVEINTSSNVNSTVTRSLIELGEATAKYSCLWLRDEVLAENGEHATLNCSTFSEHPEICKRWSDMKEFDRTVSKVEVFIQNL